MGTPLRVLIIEDSEDDTLLLLRELRKGGYEPDFLRVESAEEMRTAIDSRPWDIALSDYVLPRFSGIEALRLWRDSGIDLPFIVISGNIGEDTAVGAMKAGADDYLIKGNISRLVPAIERGLKEAETRLKKREAEEELRLRSAALDAAANAIVISDEEGRVIWANPAFTALTGYPLAEVQGRSLSILNSGIHEQEFYRELWETICAGRVWRGEMVNRRRDGSLYTEEQTITPVADDGGPIRRFIAIKQDVTERKKAQEALLENARMSCDMNVARQIQRALLPAAAPPVAGVRCAGKWVPAAHVGGDYYDFFPREDGSFDMVIADVSGHSVGAALIMTEARSVIRSQARLGGSPAAIVAALNDLLYDDLTRAELFITMFYASYAPGTRTLTFASAGHNPPLLFRGREGGGCRELDADGLILGVRTGVAFEELAVRLESGDVVLLYTDGITEAQSGDGEFFGTGRLCGVISDCRDDDPDAIIAAVLSRLAAFTRLGSLADDICMLLLKVV